MTRAPAWTTSDSAELYRVEHWGDGFFRVNAKGHMAVHPAGDDTLSIDIMDVIAEARRRGIGFPLLLRFQDVLRARVRRLNQAFAEAAADNDYAGKYHSVYPVKVNQLHEVVEEVLDAGRPYGVGLECGSKAELVATLAHLERDETLLVCNGVKDRAMLSLVLAAQRLGKNVIPVMEKFGEFEQLLGLAAENGMQTQFGVRVRLRTGGAGKWADSGGYRSKFGITLPELLEVIRRLKEDPAGHRFALLHFHLGSQISDIHKLREAAREFAQIYAELVKLGMDIRYLDVGGGLGVNYTGGIEEGGINYTLHEYANAVVSAIKAVCDARQVPQPTLVSESGRAMTAHHSVLVTEVVDAYRKDRAEPDFRQTRDAHPLAASLSTILARLQTGKSSPASPGDLIAAYHEVLEIHHEASALFSRGFLSLEQNAWVERMYWSACATVLERLRDTDRDQHQHVLQELEDQLVDQYLVDFSIFQSMLDHWAIQQPFPITPLARLDERPTRRALLVDLTCDSDGKISQYVSSREDKNYLELHELRPGEPYFLGFFLMGAYQDIMGDAHNLFGRAAEAHVYADAGEDGNFWIEKVLPGARIEEILAQVQYFPNDLHRRVQAMVKAKIECGEIRPTQGMAILDDYMASFRSETYLQNPRDNQGVTET